MPYFNYLTEQFPDSVKINGAKYEIETSFRAIVNIQLLFEDSAFSASEQAEIALGIFYLNNIPLDRKTAFDEMNRFIACNQLVYPEDTKYSNGEPALDYLIDSAKIYSAFIQQYGVDLQKKEMHWYQFKAMLDGINNGTPQMISIAQYRTMKITDDMPDDSKEMYRYYHNMYSLNRKISETHTRKKTPKEVEQEYLNKIFKPAESDPKKG